MKNKTVLVVSHQKSIQCRYSDNTEIHLLFVESVRAAIEQLKETLPDLVIVSGCMLQESNLMALLEEMRDLLPDKVNIHLIVCCHSFDGEEMPRGINFTSNDHTIGEVLIEEFGKC